ncbi:MAG: response regulator [Acidobacteriota bacterium]
MEMEDLKILVIDDNRDNLTVVNAVVSDRLPQARLITALNGPQGLELARAEDPDVILLDIVMPDMDGFEVCRRLKEDRGTEPIPVVFLAALKTDRESRVKAMQVGAEGFISKPFDDVELTAQILAMGKIKAANRIQRLEKEHLAALVAERTWELEQELAERNRVEDALRQSEKRFRLLVENSPDGIFVQNQGCFAYLNETALRLFGAASATDLAGKPVLDRFHPDFRESVLERLRLLNEEKRPVPLTEKVILRLDATPVHVEASAVPIQYEGNDGALVYVRDITERKRAEEEKERLQAQLNQAHKMEVIGTLAGGIAHDFNNILSPIMGYTEMALTEIPKDSPLRRDLEQIAAASLRARELVKQILAFARDGENKKRPLCASLVIKEALELLRSTLPSTIEIRRHISKEAAASTIVCDPTQLHQILLNLCTNSAHAMREKGGVLQVDLENVQFGPDMAPNPPEAEPGPYLRLSVTDTGHGMTQEVMRRIFDPYFTTKSPGEGTGLGLSTVYGIVNSHKGFISVESQPGEGSVFHVLLPRIEPQPVARERTDEPMRTGRGRVLLVDDEGPLLEMTRRLLDRLGYRVVARSSSIAALDEFRNDPKRFDLIVTDQTMPHMTGADLSREILSIRPDIPVILCTGFSETVTEENARAIGIRKMFMKPFSVKELAEAVRQLLP